jgi:hypothetical protein
VDSLLADRILISFSTTGLLDRSGYAERFAEESRQADRKYSKLPAGFSAEILSWIPRGYTLQVRGLAI